MTTRRELLLAALAAPLLACKRKRAPGVPEVWDEEAVPGTAEAIAALAPPWPAPARGQLDNGLVTFWLHEPEAPAVHIRLLVPTSTRAFSLPAAGTAIVAEHLRFEWQRRVQRYDAVVRVEHGPDRLEVSAHGREDQLAGLLGQLASTLAARAPATLPGAAERLLELEPTSSNLELASSATVAQLLGHDDAIARTQLSALSRTQVLELWQTLTDPRDAVLLVHAGAPAADGKPLLRRLSEQWRGVGRRDVDGSAIGRLQPRRELAPHTTRLLSAPVTPLRVVPGVSGSATVAMGRVLPLPDAKTRAFARLAQRVAQEEMDATLVIAGDIGLWVVASTLSGANPDRDLQREVDRLSSFARARQPKQRLFQAVQLWLGARVVEASLGGEDWTRLFAASMDLSRSDAEVASALARDAAAMLAATPEALGTWATEWLDPRAGEPGWAWAAAGLDEAAVKRIARVIPVEPRSA